MIDHITIRVSDLKKSVEFYRKALAPVGYTLLAEFPEGVGFGHGRPDLWLSTDKPLTANCHFCIPVDSQEKVQAFYQAALQAGGKDNGPPGPRPHYGPEYYGGFVLDPDGNNVEAMVRKSK